MKRDDVTEEAMCDAVVATLNVSAVTSMEVTGGDFKHKECIENYDDVQL